MSYVVTAPLVIVKNPENGGRDAYLYEGAPVPSFVSAERLADLERDGLIAKAGSADGSTPAKSASKGDWVAYAVSQGVPEDEAEAATRDELAARFTA